MRLHSKDSPSGWGNNILKPSIDPKRKQRTPSVLLSTQPMELQEAVHYGRSEHTKMVVTEAVTIAGHNKHTRYSPQTLGNGKTQQYLTVSASFAARANRRLDKLVTRIAVLDPILRTMPFGFDFIVLRPNGREDQTQDGQRVQTTAFGHFCLVKRRWYCVRNARVSFTPFARADGALQRHNGLWVCEKRTVSNRAVLTVK